MKKDYIESGKIVGTHGVKGGLRVQPWCDSPEFLCQFKKLFFKEKNGYNAVKVKSAKPPYFLPNLHIASNEPDVHRKS